SEKEVLAKVDSAVVDEVSVGLLTQHAFCSECDFDYFGPEATFTNIVMATCDQGHEIGVDGVHAKLVGLVDWAELSLVGSGAARNAKVLPKAKHSFKKETLDKLAADGVNI